MDKNILLENCIKHALITNKLLKEDGPSKILSASAYSYKQKVNTVCKHCKTELEYIPKRHPVWEATLTCPVCNEKQWESVMVLSLT